MELKKRESDFLGPFDLISDLQWGLNRAFDRNMTKYRDFKTGFSPDVDLNEEKDHYELCADLPGIEKKNLNIEVESNVLTIKGERRHEQKTGDKSYHLSERFEGSFTRIVEFPSEIQADKVKASYTNGVLEITVPKSENARPKQIQVEIK